MHFLIIVVFFFSILFFSSSTYVLISCMCVDLGSEPNNKLNCLKISAISISLNQPEYVFWRTAFVQVRDSIFLIALLYNYSGESDHSIII